MRSAHSFQQGAARALTPARHLLRAIGLTVALLCAAAGGPASAQTRAPQNEYAVKAAFLFNFAKFVEWPPEAFPTADSPVVIGIVGSDPFGSILDDLTRDERINGRSILVRRLKWDDDIASCHLLFVSPSEWRQMPQLVARLDGTSVLTVGEHDGFATSGGMIHLAREDYRIRFEINLRAAERARLKISSKLLSLATIVSGPVPQETPR